MAQPKTVVESKGPPPIREDELRGILESVLEENDPFYIPPEIIPEGYSVEWKVQTVLGQRAPNQNDIDMQRTKTRWENVDLETHPSFRSLVPEGYDKNTIENGGRILMIRPTQITDMVRKAEEAKAKDRLTNQMAKVSDTGSGEAPRKVLSVKRSYEGGIEVPSD